MENKILKKKKVSFHDEFETFLNAVFYGFWKKESEFMEKGMEIARHISRKVIELLCPGKYRVQLYRKMLRNQNKCRVINKDMHSGFYIRMAMASFRICETFYLIFPLVIIWGVSFGWLCSIIPLQLIFICLIVLTIVSFFTIYLPIDRIVFKNDRYIKYFQKFATEDNKWLKKWKRNAWLFEIGACMALLLGGLCAGGLVILIDN